MGMQRLTVKTSTIFIAKGGRTRVFHSLDEVPPNPPIVSTPRRF